MEESENSSREFWIVNSEISNGERITCIVLNVILMVLIVFGNGFLLFVLMKVRDLKRSSRIFLVSLTLADLVVGVFVVPVHIILPIIGISFGDPWAAPERLCEALFFVEAFAIGSSVLSVLALTVERYLAVEMPLKFRSLVTSRRALVVVGCSWLMSLCWASVIVTTWRVSGSRFVIFDEASSMCVVNALDGTTFYSFMGFMVVYFLIPLCVTFIASIRILHIVKSRTAYQKQQVHNNGCNCGRRQTGAASGAQTLRQRMCTGVCRGLCKCFLGNKKALITVLIVTLSYSASSVPFVVCVFEMKFSYHDGDRFLVELAGLSMLTSCFINVFVYTARHRAFRGTAKRILRRLLPANCGTVREQDRSQWDLQGSSSTQDTYL